MTATGRFQTFVIFVLPHAIPDDDGATRAGRTALDVIGGVTIAARDVRERVRARV